MPETYPIGVDAINVDMANGNNLEEEISLLKSTDINLQAEIESVASGSPAGVYSTVAALTSADPDHDKIYLVTADGKWYYYNNEWLAGGIYQSTGIGINSVNPENLNSARFSTVFKFYENNLKPISNDWQSGAWDGSRILSNVNAISCYSVSLKIGDVISLVGEFEFCIFKGNTCLRDYSTSDYTISTNGNDYAFIIVKNPREDISQYVDSAKNIVGISNYDAEFTSIVYDNLDINLKNSIDATIGKVTLDSNSNWKSGYYNTSQAYIVASGYSTSQPIKVKNGYKLKSNVNGADTVYTLFKCNQDGTLIEGLKTGTGNDPIDFNFDINFDGYIAISYRNVGISNVYVIINKTVENLQNQIDEINYYIGKDASLISCNYVSEGDSITNRNGKASNTWQPSTGYTPYETPIINGYQNYVVEKLNCNLSNYGVEGWKITSGVNAILDRNYTNVDLVTIAYGVNDAREGSVLGTLGGYSDTTFDTSTFTGAYRTAINHILNDNPHCKIILMTPIQRGFINNFGTDTVNSQGLTMNDYRERIFEIAKIYSLPVCDCFAESEINNYNITKLTIDGVHPNNAGYKCMGKLLCNIINKL